MKAENEPGQKTIRGIVFPANAPAALAGMGEDIAHEVDAATLPRRAQHLRDSCLQAQVRIRDDQLHTAQAPAGQAAQELGPVFPVSDCETDRQNCLRRISGSS